MIRHNENGTTIISKIVKKLKQIRFNKVYVLATIEEVTGVKRRSLIRYNYLTSKRKVKIKGEYQYIDEPTSKSYFPLTSNARLIILRKVKVKGKYQYIDELTNTPYFMIDEVVFLYSGESYISNILRLANTLEDTQKLKHDFRNYQERLIKEEKSSRVENGIKVKSYLESLIDENNTDKNITFEIFDCSDEICQNCVICHKVEYETLLRNVRGFPVCIDCISKYSK